MAFSAKLWAQARALAGKLVTIARGVLRTSLAGTGEFDAPEMDTVGLRQAPMLPQPGVAESLAPSPTYAGSYGNYGYGYGYYWASGFGYGWGYYGWGGWSYWAGYYGRYGGWGGYQGYSGTYWYGGSGGRVLAGYGLGGSSGEPSGFVDQVMQRLGADMLLGVDLDDVAREVAEYVSHPSNPIDAAIASMIPDGPAAPPTAGRVDGRLLDRVLQPANQRAALVRKPLEQRAPGGMVQNDVANLTSQTDSLGHATTRVYDALDRVISITDRAATQTFSYDLLGRLLAETDRLGRTTTHVYDFLGAKKRDITYIDGSGGEKRAEISDVPFLRPFLRPRDCDFAIYAWAL